MPPSGDLRAPRSALLEACDREVLVGDGPDADVRVLDHGVRQGDRLVAWQELAGARVGLFTAIARPWRVVRHLARRGVTPVAALHAGDHRVTARVLDAVGHFTRANGVDLWLATEKCGTHLEELGRRGIPIGVLDGALLLSDDLRRSLLLPM